MALLAACRPQFLKNYYLQIPPALPCFSNKGADKLSIEFGELLKRYRRQSSDPLRGGALTQERLAELLEQYAPLHSYSTVTISNWEHGKTLIKQDKRDVLTALISILHDCDGLHSLTEAQEFLHTGNYRQLNENEISRIDKDWLQQHRQSQDSRGDGGPRIPEKRSDPGMGWSLRELINSAFSARSKTRSRVDNQPIAKLYPSSCGDIGINLDQQRLMVSNAFGTYFAGLLEQQQNYINLVGQIDYPGQPGQEALDPLEGVYWTLQYPKGAHVMIIAADGGMGKSTLASRIARCFYQIQALDLLLGDSAKNERFNTVSAEIIPLTPGYYDVSSFFRKIASQLGLPERDYQHTTKQFVAAVQERLAGRRALIIVDNLEVIEKEDELLRILTKITSRDVRAIVTTRSLSGFSRISDNSVVIHLRPIVDLQEAIQFLEWHVDHYLAEQPSLQNLRTELTSYARINEVLKLTGGIPLLMQLIFSDVARLSWHYVSALPTMFSTELLQYLYQARWDELASLGPEGLLSQNILAWVAHEQYSGRTVTLRRMVDWSERQSTRALLSISLRQLHQRFLITNSDKVVGNFAIFPSLADFLRTKQ